MLRICHELTTFKEVEDKAKELNKDILLILSSEGCPPCFRLESMLKEFETDKEVEIFALKRPKFNDMEVFKTRYGLASFPTLIVVDANLNKKDMDIGYKGEDAFETFINKNF